MKPTATSPPAAWQTLDDLSVSRNYEIKLMPLRDMGRAAGVDSPALAVDYIRRHVFTAPWFDPCRECLVTLFLDTRHRSTGFALVGIGTLDSVIAAPREIFRAAIVRAASAILIAHNHPSGDPSPSDGDISRTRELRCAGGLLHIELLDHLIVGEKHLDPTGAGYRSLRELGYFADNTSRWTKDRKRSKGSSRSKKRLRCRTKGRV